MFNATLPGSVPGTVIPTSKPVSTVSQTLWKSFDDILVEGLKYIEDRAKGSIQSLLTQWPTFNSIGLNGLEWHSLYVIAARPGVGKTLIANAITRRLHALNKTQDFNILHFQFEMLGRNMALRELSAATNLNIRYLQSAKDSTMIPLTRPDYEKLLHYVASQRGRQEYVIDKPLTVESIRKAIYDFYATHRKPFVITLDHTLLVKTASSETSKMATLQNLSTMMTEVKNELPVIFLILTQLNREIDDATRQEPGKLLNYPTEADVYGSDYLLQCADVMMAYNRPAKYNLSAYGPERFVITPLDKFLLAQHVLKNRFGETGLYWYKAEYATMNVVETPAPMRSSAFSAKK
jgi:replicative DNA helicase